MSNHLKHIAVKNIYYSSKTFGSATTHNIQQNIGNIEHGSIINLTARLYI